MPTSYSEIYCLNKIIKNDPRLSKLNACELNILNFKYLEFAISYFMYDCRGDLNDRVDPTSSKYTFDGTGVETEFLLAPVPQVDSTILVYTSIGDDYPVQADFTYDVSTGIVTMKQAPSIGTTINVYAYTVGQFNWDLDIREKNILAEGMSVPYKEESASDQNAMKYIVTGKSLRFFSQANHVDVAIKNVDEQAYTIVNSLISEYTYKGSRDSYGGLAGRGRGR